MQSFESLIPLVLAGAILWISAVAIKLSAAKYPPAVADNEGPSGVGGWLLFVVFCLMVFGPLAGIGRTILTISQAEAANTGLNELAKWQSLKSAEWACVLAIAGLSFYAGNILRKNRTPETVRRAQLVIWVAGPVGTIMSEIIIPKLILATSETSPTGIGAAIGSVFGAAIWTSYLRNSKRVAVTYGSAHRSDA